jgi:hypothetical protein
MNNAKIAGVIKEAADHYDRMINGYFENSYKLSPSPDMTEFNGVVGETWSAADCPLCKAFHHSEPNDDRCDGCPVHEFFKGCSRTPHHYLRQAMNWDQWVDAARMEFDVLMLLYSYYIERAESEILSLQRKKHSEVNNG